MLSYAASGIFVFYEEKDTGKQGILGKQPPIGEEAGHPQGIINQKRYPNELFPIP